MHYSTARQNLIDLGYIPLPIMPRDKKPAIKNWTDPNYVPPGGHGGYGVGILCGRGEHPISGIDCDILDKDIAAHMQSFIFSLCGNTVYRIGRSPKTMYVFRAEKAGIRKTSSKHYEIGHVEMWGDGQQFVCFGTHPDTKKPYTWPNKSILDTHAKSLPVVTIEQLKKIIAEFERVAEAAGYKPVSKTKLDKPLIDEDFDPDDPLDSIEPVGLPLDKCKEILKDLDPDCTREEWLNIGMALHHEFSGSREALELWDEWSSKGAKYTAGQPESYWHGFGKYRGRPITAAYLLKIEKKESLWEEADFFKKLDWSTSRFLSEPPAIPMVVNGFLPRGIVSMLYSAGGAGKSTVSLHMAIRVALADAYNIDFLGHTVQGGKVVILTAEDPDLILNRRYIGIVDSIADELMLTRDEVRKAVEKNLSIVSTFGHSVQLFKLNSDSVLVVTKYYESLLSCLHAIEDLQLVFIDTKTRFSPGEGLGNVTATQEITHYERIASETGASVMLLHHSTKTSRDGSQTGAQAYRDATALFDSVRAAWYLRGCTETELAAQEISDDTPGKYLLLENSKNNYIPLCPPVILEREGYRFTPRQIVKKMSVTEKKEQRRQKAYDRVIEILQTAKGDWHSQAEVIRLCKEQLSLGRRLVVEVLDDLKEDGIVDWKIEGISHRYALTEQGKLYNITIE
jgi:RecA-family ATPase